MKGAGSVLGAPADRMLKRVAQRLNRTVGLRTYNEGTIWHRDQEFLKLFKEWHPDADGINDRQYMLYHFACATAMLPGDTVECGVRRGAGSWLILKATANQDKTHHLYDSFEGLSDPGAFDNTNPDALYVWHRGDLAVSEEVVRRNLAAFPNLRFHKGWIPESFDASAPGKVAFVHVDVDLYEPTRDSIAFFYDRLVPGGILLCDDYHSNSCPGAKRAFDEVMADKPEPIIKTVTDQALIIKR